MLTLLTMLMTAGPAQASDLLVPTFSLEPGSETAGAEIMYSAVLEALRAREIEFLDADDIAEFAGNDGLNCAARPECPAVLWEKVKGTLAMTATVGMKGETLNVLVEFHRPGKKDAIEFVQDELPAKKAGELAMDLALITQDLLNNKDETVPAIGAAAVGDDVETGDPLGDISPDGPVPAAPLDGSPAVAGVAGAAVAGAALKGAAPSPGAAADKADDAAADKADDAAADKADDAAADKADDAAADKADDAAADKADDAAAAEKAEAVAPAVGVAPAPIPGGVADKVDAAADLDEAPKFDPAATASALGVTKGAFASYKDSGLSPEEWAAEMKVRSRRFFIELHAGVTMGDVKRRFATRVAVQQLGEERFKALGYYRRDTLLPGAAFSTAASFGYTPAWWFEGGLLLGLEFPRKELITGWEAYGPEDDYASRSPGSQDQVVYQPATAMTFLLEPRVRLLMASTGTVKPYLLGGYSLRFYDGYETEDLPQVDLPDREGIMSSGPMAGLGLSFDPKQKSSGFIEASGVQFLTPEVFERGKENVSKIPREEDGIGYAVSIRAGVTTRF